MRLPIAISASPWRNSTVASAERSPCRRLRALPCCRRAAVSLPAKTSAASLMTTSVTEAVSAEGSGASQDRRIATLHDGGLVTPRCASGAADGETTTFLFDIALNVEAAQPSLELHSGCCSRSHATRGPISANCGSKTLPQATSLRGTLKPPRDQQISRAGGEKTHIVDRSASRAAG
jgi:hypothetical protein